MTKATQDERVFVGACPDEGCPGELWAVLPLGAGCRPVVVCEASGRTWETWEWSTLTTVTEVPLDRLPDDVADFLDWAGAEPRWHDLARISPFDPFAAAARRGVLVFLHDFDTPAMHGGTDGVHRVWVKRVLTHSEMRSTLTHELVHIWQGHRGAQSAEVERWVGALTAAVLLPPDTLSRLDDLDASLSPAFQAEYLGVDPWTLAIALDERDGR